jgi:hypothetical protein
MVVLPQEDGMMIQRCHPNPVPANGHERKIWTNETVLGILKKAVL